MCLAQVGSAVAVAQSEADYEQQLQKLAKTIKQLQQELSRVRSEKDQLNVNLERSEQEAADLTEKIKAIQEALAREKKRLNQHQTERSELEITKRQQQRDIEEVLRQAHSLGHQSQLKLLLNQEDPSHISRLMQYHRYIVDAQVEKLTAYQQTIAKISETETAINRSALRLAEQEKELSQQFTALKSTQAKRLASLAALNKELASKGESLSQMQSNQQRLQQLLEEASKALAHLTLPERDTQPFAQTRGSLNLPAQGRIKHRYGSSRLDGQLRWDGLFLSGEAGSAVNSIHYGRVIFSDYLRGYGLVLIVDHGDGYMSLYAHNQTLQKETGDWVSRGEAIATLGNTGGQDEAGLYFELRHQGKPINPHRWFM